MSRRIEIELTSARPDGSWTWRVAGAKQPKGLLEGSLLPDGAKVGDVLRADADVELEGTVITTILGAPPKRQEPERLQILGDGKPFEAVTTNLAPKGSRPKRDWAEVRPRNDRGPGPGGRPSPGGRPGGPGARPGGPAGTGGFGGRSDRPAAGAPGSDRPPRPDRNARPDQPAGDRPSRPDGDRSSTDRTDRRRPPTPGERTGAGRRPATPDGRNRDQGGPRPKRLNPSSVHRDAVLESLAPEERPVAEQLLQGGIPAVRRAVQERNVQARDDGRPEVKADALMTLAEELLPRLKAAEWRDRADAAIKDIDELNIRDLRSIVAGADAGARDDDGRILAKTLREALEGRETAERDTWLKEVTTCLDEGKVTRALRVAGRPPDPRTRFPAEMTTRLIEAASSAMSPDTSPDRWAALLAAVLESPVRRAVKPAGLPATPGDALLTAARQASGRIPALAAMLGLDMPPPPGPPRPGMRPPRPPARTPGGGQRRPTPPGATGGPKPTEAPGGSEDHGGSAIIEQSPVSAAPLDAQTGTPVDPAGSPTSAERVSAPTPTTEVTTSHEVTAPHAEPAPPLDGGGTDDQPTPGDAARVDPPA
ncbi:MAG: hypothetical protein NVS3B21_03840 [Acidimicrobiales bacterium]